MLINALNYAKNVMKAKCFRLFLHRVVLYVDTTMSGEHFNCRTQHHDVW